MLVIAFTADDVTMTVGIHAEIFDLVAKLIYPKVVTLERFYRGSTMLATTAGQVNRWGPSLTCPWIPLPEAQCGEPSRATAKSTRE